MNEQPPDNLPHKLTQPDLTETRQRVARQFLKPREGDIGATRAPSRPPDPITTPEYQALFGG